MIFSRLNIGAKVSCIIALLVVVCVCALSICVILFSKEAMEGQNEKILNQSTYRYANLFNGVAMQTLDLLHARAGVIDMQINNNPNISDLENAVASLLESIRSTNYVYLYIPRLNISLNGTTNQQQVVILAGQGSIGEKPRVIEDNGLITQFESIHKAMINNRASLSDPQKINFQNRELFVQSFSVPIHDANGNAIGALGCLVDFNIIGAPFLSPEAQVFVNDQRFVINENGIISVNQNPQYVGAKLDQLVPTQQAKDIVVAAKQGRGGIFPYRTAAGIEGVISMYAVEPIPESGAYWNIISYIPNSSIMQPIIKLTWIIIVLGVASIVLVVLVTMLYLRVSVTSRIRIIRNILAECFKYLNHETKQPPVLVPVNSHDELGNMAEAINANIEKTQKSLEQDSHAVS
ncbi:chemotaxis protein, partial [Helicobacter aurati]